MFHEKTGTVRIFPGLLESFEDAEPAFKRALKTLDTIAELNGENSDVKLELAKCLNGLGLCWEKLTPRMSEGEEPDAADSVETAADYYDRAAKTVEEALKTAADNVDETTLDVSDNNNESYIKQDETIIPADYDFDYTIETGSNIRKKKHQNSC